ncbi:MAG: hypothetical protein ABJB97_02210 [Acidobacteriota bacterium]
MNDLWLASATSTHQDHIIAHVIGTTVTGYFVFNEALYILLDIGFLWWVYVDGEMGLLPHPVAVSELEIDEDTRDEIKTDIDLLLRDGTSAEGLSRMTACQVACRIQDVSLFMHEDKRRLLVFGEEANLAIESSMNSGEICIGQA